MQTVRHVLEWIEVALELLAVAVIVASIVVAAFPRVARLHGAVERNDVFSAYKQRMGRGLLLGLELLLAADVVGTVTSAPTIERLSALGVLTVIRTFLSWSLDVEIEGRWPWQARAEPVKRAADAQ